MSSLLEYALAYAGRGWPVFPVHTPVKGGCSCRRADCSRVGKHPRISTGRSGATTDPEIIAKWWKVWPDANIGIATGQESGLIVLDVDDGGEDSLVGRDLPDTVEQITGSGGRHLLYRRPSSDNRYRTLVKFLPGLDTRADGGYIVAPPSVHQSGSCYEWEGSSDPMDGVDTVEPPLWLIEAIETAPIEQSIADAPAWNPDGSLPNNITDMLSAIPSADYDIWRDVGMALHYTDPVDGFAAWDWWSGTAENYSAQAVRDEWANFSRRGHAVSNPVTISTIRRLAEQYGWIDPDIEHGAEIAANFMASRQREIAAEIHNAIIHKSALSEIKPPEIMPPRGLIRDIAERILATSVRPQPELAVMAAATFIGALSGRKYQTETGLRSNLYTVGLAESGAGKDHARKEIGKLAHLAGVSEYIGGERIASGPGVISALIRQPSQVFMLDEFGLMLQAMTGQRSDSHKRDLMAALMTLYSAAGGVYRGTEYADQRDRPRQDIVHPNACIYGTSTPSQFYSALTSSQGVDGTLSRLIVAVSDEHRPIRQRPDLAPPHPHLIDNVVQLHQYQPGGGNLSGKGGADMDMQAHLVRMDGPVYDAWEALDDDMTQYMTDPASRSVYSRVAENAAKLAMVYAISINHCAPRIDADAFMWGREIALWTANTMMREVARYVADNEQEASYKRVLNAVSDAPNGITRRDLLRTIRTLRKRDLEDIITTLTEAGEISIENRKNERGPATTVYVAVDR